MIENKKIIITGGTGFLGKNIIRRYYNNNELTIFSRDEAKQYYLKKQYPNLRCIVGDIRNLDLLSRSCHNQDLAIFAASFKQIEAVYDNYEEANEVIVKGAFNSRRAAEDNNLEAACFVSSDKSRAATTIYGAMKFTAGESFIANTTHLPIRLSTVIYGNVANSTGSIIPLIWDSIKNNRTLNLYGAEMTRFILDVEDAIDLIEKAFYHTGVNLIPVTKSIRIVDLFEIYKSKFGLKCRITEPRSGEKIHESMAGNEETRRMYLVDEHTYIMHPTIEYNKLNFPKDEYNSKDWVMNKHELEDFLSKRNYYKQ
jgi:UDP-glucose 4-epimerase